MCKYKMSKKVVFAPYNDEIDYCKLVIEYEKRYNSHEYKTAPVEEVWTVNRTKEKDNRLFYSMHCSNMVRMSRQRSLAEEMKFYKDQLKDKSKDFDWAFVTINFDDTCVTVATMKKFGFKVWEKDFIGPGSQMVFEKHRQDEGIHHHIHLLIHFTQELSPSRVCDLIYKVSGGKAIIRDNNFIDYKGPRKAKKGHSPYEVYTAYVAGDKRAEKLPYVALDKIWRLENKIEHLYVKN